ncbi:MAG: antibiotic biosynthesis monooxygenase [Gammaproteobacteria bacterium]
MPTDIPEKIIAVGGYAVIFSSSRTDTENESYRETAERMLSLAAQQPGFLGVESVRETTGDGITVSYWSDLASIEAWKNNAEHRVARQHGREHWYQSFNVRICKIEKEYTFNENT